LTSPNLASVKTSLFSVRDKLSSRGGPRDRSDLERELKAEQQEHEDLKIFTENLIASVNDMVFVIGSDGRFQFVSGNSLGVMGYPQQDLTGKQFIDLVASGFVAAAVSNFEKIMWGDSAAAYELEVTGADGEVHSIEVASGPYRREGNVVAQVGVARDITTQKTLQRQIDERNRQLSALEKLAESVASQLESDELVSTSIERMMHLCAADFGWAYLTQREGGDLVLKNWKGFGRDAVGDDATGGISLDEALSGDVSREFEPRLMTADELAGPMSAVLRQADAKSIVTVPLVAAGELVGVLGLGACQQDHFTPGDTGLLRVACNHVALSLRNAELRCDAEFNKTVNGRRNIPYAV
jgi:PAS domain S-box-containing protein